MHGGTGPHPALDLQVATDLPDEAVDLAQAEPGAGVRLGGEERVERTLQNLRALPFPLSVTVTRT